MICTECGSYNCFRSHRRKFDFAFVAMGILPWRCVDCRARFYARRVPLRYLHYAHCPRCSSFELRRIRRDKLGLGWRGHVALSLGARALRCDYCRHNFASWRLIWPSREAGAESHQSESGAGAFELSPARESSGSRTGSSRK